MKKINAYLLIVGNGELYSELNELIVECGVQDKVTIKKSVPNNQIQNYYKSAKVFALAYNTEVETLPMPVMEAMATGLPIVIPFPKEGFSEGLEKIAMFTKNNEKSFIENINKLLDDDDLQRTYSKQSLNKSVDFDLQKIETREAEIYQELIKGFKK